MRRVFRFSSWIAALAAFFLIYSSLDDIPDIPGMLNSKSTKTLLSKAPHHGTSEAGYVGLISASVPPPIPDAEPLQGTEPAVIPTTIAQAIHRAANLPPPAI